MQLGPEVTQSLLQLQCTLMFYEVTDKVTPQLLAIANLVSSSFVKRWLLLITFIFVSENAIEKLFRPNPLCSKVYYPTTFTMTTYTMSWDV